MADYTRNYDFQAGAVISSSQVDEELNDIATAIATKPDADGTVQASLNADQVDGFHAADDGGDGTIPVCSGTVQTNLNAEMIGGLTASDLSQAGFAPGTAMVFYQSAAPSGWTKVSNPSIDRVLAVSSSGAGGANNGESTWVENIAATIAAHTLTTSEIPAVPYGSMTIGGTLFDTGGAVKAVHIPTTGSSSVTTTSLTPTGTIAGGGGSHTHTGSYATIPSDYRPPIKWVIICTKDA